MKKFCTLILRNSLFLFLTSSSVQLKAQTVTIEGTGVASSYLYSPIYSFNAAPRSLRIAYIYSQSLLSSMPAGSIIDKLQFSRNSATGTMPAGNNLKLYLMNTSSTDWGAGTITWDVSSATLVFDGDPSTIIGSTNGYKEFIVNSGFMYTGSNLALFSEYAQVNAPATTINWDYNTSTTQPGYSTNQTKYTVSSTSTMPATMASSTTNHPNIKIDFSASGPCTSPPTPGTSIASATIVCPSTVVQLTLSGHTTGSGQTYVWESSPTLAGSYTTISGTLTSTFFTITPANNAYYRAAVSCGATTATSTPVLITINPGLSGVYTIDKNQPGSTTNFISFTEFATAIACGVLGPVTINVAAGSGPYTEQFVLPVIPGVSATNTIVINGNGNTLQFTPVTGARHLIKFNGADYVTIDNFTFIGQDATYCWGVFLTNASDHNTISNCIIDMTAITSTTEANSVGIVASASSTTVMSTGNNANFLSLVNNTISGGYRGIGLNGVISTNINANLTANTIQDFYAEGIKLSNVAGAVIVRNNIHRTTRVTVTTFAGIELDAGCSGNLINANRIHDTHTAATSQSGIAYGVYLNSTDATAGSENKITNNLIYNFNSLTGTQYGLYNSGSDGAWYFHNTVVLDNGSSTSGTTRGFYQLTTAANIKFQNNIVYITRAGTGVKYALYFGTTTSAITSNTNALYINAPAGTNAVGFYSIAYTTLADWQTANAAAYDQQSSGVDPAFINPGSGDYVPGAAVINNIGANVGVATDILGNLRNIAAPDPGAYEFSGGACPNPPTTGTVITTELVACASASFTLDLTGNSIGEGQTYQWQSSTDNSSWSNLGSPQATSAYITSQTVNTYYRVVVTCSAGTPANSASILVTTPGAASGTFTINSLAPTGGTNFQTFHDAIEYIKCTINGPVVFNVAAGTNYNEQVIIPAVGGTSAINTITINGNGASLSYISANAGQRAVIKLDGTDYISINNLVINSPGTTTSDYGYGIQMINDADHNTISNCTFNLNTSLSSSNFAGIVINSLTATTPVAGGNSQCDFNTIVGNTITGGYAGITVVSNGTTNTVTGNTISNNVITDFYIYGIYLNGNYNALVERNDVSRPTRTTVSTFYGVYLSTGNLGAKVSKNKLHDSFNGSTASTSASYGIYTTSSDATPGNENIFFNNFIYNFNNSGFQYGIYNSGSAYAKYYHNSILLDGPATASNTYDTRGFYQTTAAIGLEYKNNIVVISRASIGENHCIYFVTATSEFVSDNNDFYITTTTGTLNNVGFFNAIQYPALADWKAGTLQDVHSVSMDPLFISVSDLHLQPSSPMDDKGTAIASVTVDIDGESRDVATPDIGADELPLSSGIDVKASALLAPAAANGCYSANEPVSIRIKNNSSSTHNFATEPVTTNVNITGAVTTSLNAIVNSGILAAGATLTVTMTGTLNMSVSGTYIFNASTSLGTDVNPANDAMPQETRTKIALLAGTPAATPSTYCLNGGSPTLSTSGAAGYSALHWQQSSTSGTGFTNIPGGTTTPFTVPSPVNQTMYYKLLTYCSGSTATSAEISIIFNNPQVTSTTPGSRCGPGTVDLSASGSPGSTLYWYSTPSGGTATGSGNLFTTPGISTTTTYYVAASVAGGTGSVGPLNPAEVSGSGGGTNAVITTYYMSFDVLVPTTLTSVDIFPTATIGSNASIVIQNSAGATLATIPYVTTVTGGATAQTIPINISLSPGVGYKMGQSPAVNLYRNTAGAVYPYTSSGINITGNNFDPAYYYYFYNWQFGTGCESLRTPVTATINSTVDNMWTGAASTAWENPANWSCEIVPDMNTNVVIPSGANVVVNSNAHVRSLTVNTGATVTVNSGFDLTVHN